MTILITGAAGQVGSELVERAGHRPVAAFTRAELNISDGAAVQAAVASIRPKLIINAAAYTAVDKAEAEREAAFAINCDGPRVLARAAAVAAIPVFHISTDYVFDGSRNTPYPEDAPAAPLGVYGQSKWAGEEAIRLELKQHLILRVAWVFGAHGNNFVKTMLKLGASRPELRVVDDQRGGPTHAGAIADTLLGLADRVLAGEALAWGTYHYTGEPVVSWHGFAQKIFDEASLLGLIENKPLVHAITTAEYPTPAKRPANSALDGSLAKAQLGIGRRQWLSGLRETLQSLKQSA